MTNVNCSFLSASCPKCTLDLIQEESEIHECYNPKNKRFFFDTDNDFVEVFDGLNWIKIKSQQPKGNRNKTTDNETEPGIIPAKTEILV